MIIHKLKSGLLLFIFIAFSAFAVVKNDECDSETYDGEKRDSAKTSISAAKLETFTSFSKFTSSLMNGADIYKLAIDESRCKEEERNVEITVWIYTYIRETDEDYHVIVGSTDNPATAEYFNVEVSGLPKNKKSKYYKRLIKPRNQFKKLMGITTCVKNKNYSDNKLSKPLKVKIKGSLFFDRPHQNSPPDKKPGPSWAKPKTAWEIHPLTNIVKAK